MFERFKRDGSSTRETTARGSTAVADRPAPPHNGPTTRPHARADQEQMHAVRARQREEFGGINWGAAFFGWLVAVGLGVLLVGLLAAAGAAVGLTELSEGEATGNATEIGLGGGLAPAVPPALTAFSGGGAPRARGGLA